ncbi:hypothetical protein TNIN_392741 [Trichonephila inaurata madagascariensis]|uniref:Uncharacterized protein n=1 Tax=Trichonephila inaurata madagascariensis TaxID=2747483 RepID=A0A8X6JV10_9ARAC|nr:hypothetical protein TNIN_392741 [Trichonephila inaurata madagascariensis]
MGGISKIGGLRRTLGETDAGQSGCSLSEREGSMKKNFEVKTAQRAGVGIGQLAQLLLERESLPNLEVEIEISEFGEEFW